MGSDCPFHMYDMLSVKSLVCGLWSDLFVEMQRERERERERGRGPGEGVDWVLGGGKRRGDEELCGKGEGEEGREEGGKVCGFW